MSHDREPRRGLGKGRLGRLGLPIASDYLRPTPRRRMLWLGVALAVIALIVVGIDMLVDDAALISGGPLSSAHAMLQNDCSSCHGGAFEPVTDAACSTCHEKFGDDIGRYSFASHYLYRSNDFQRLGVRDHEMTCAECHAEHRGQEADIQRVSDRACVTCHERSSFAGDHPEFAFADDPTGDDHAIAFAHGQHVREVMEVADLVDLERACLACHEPDDRGRGFRAISFDRHCDACHLTQGVATPRLPLAGDADDAGIDDEEATIGVLSLASIRASAAPSTEWSLFMNPNEFRGAGRSVAKTPLHHQDPWVLYNLRRLRRMLYPDAGLVDLLVTSAEVSDTQAGDSRALYQEAIDTLDGMVVGLRGSADPGVQQRLQTIEALLERVRRTLDDPLTPLDESEFMLALDRPADLDAATKQEIDDLVADLSAPCATCHQVERATIVRADADQKTLTRSEFAHSAHVIQRRCLDCHHVLPIEAAIAGATVPAEQDQSAIYNLPPIASCRECHQPGLAADGCTSCHLFHADSGRHSELLLYRPENERTEGERPETAQSGEASDQPTATTSEGSEA